MLEVDDIEICLHLNINISIRLLLLSENLVGNVIDGRKLFEIMMSKNSATFAFSFNFNKFIL